MPRGVKGRKKGPGVRAGEAANLLNAINQDGLDEQEILRILQVDLAPCDHVRSPCRANRKDNVACFCQLVPAETSFRKKGLWQKEQAHLGTLGQDPVENKREADAKPSGLRNLGNTCYANAALQCLFSVPSLRNGIFGAEPRVAAHDIFRQLQALFLQMQFGPRSSVDTEDLAKTLGLDHAIQQDGQEFLKLLLTRVEQMLSKSSDTAARRLVQCLFRGGLSYVTTCQRCGRDSVSSREVQDFYDLMPQVRGFSNLTESLAAILHADSLTGDNRYRCEFCSDKVDALRHVRLRSLPPYLCLALQRFYFDPRTADKAKALDKFGFPLQLDFRQVLAAAAASNALHAEAEGGGGASSGSAAAAAVVSAALDVPLYATGSPLYALVGILIHKGSQASSGHYVAHIKDQATGQWWRFDDESVNCIGPSPTAAFHADHGAVVAAAGMSATAEGAGKAASGGSRKRPAAADPSEDPDYDDDQEAREQQAHADDEDDGAPQPNRKPSGRGDRGRKAAAQGGGRGRGRAAKRGALGTSGRSRGRPRAILEEGEGAGDDEMARAIEASLDMLNAGGDSGGGLQAAAAVDEDDDLRRALAASLASGAEDTDMVAVLEEGACLHAVAPAGTMERGVGGGEVPGSGAAMDQDAWDGQAAAPLKVSADAVTARMPAAEVALAGGPLGTNVHVGPQASWADEAEPGSRAPLAAASAEGSDPAAQPAGGQVVSANAYMLVYRAIGFREPPVLAEAASLPGELQAVVSSAAAAFAEQCDVYQRQRQALKEQVESRQRVVREIMSFIAPHPNAAKQRQQPHPPVKGEVQQQQEQPIDLTCGAAAANVHAVANGCVADATKQQQQQQKPVQQSHMELEYQHMQLEGLDDAKQEQHRAQQDDLDEARQQRQEGQQQQEQEQQEHKQEGLGSADKQRHQQDPSDSVLTSMSTAGYWLSTAWLERWANDEGPPPPIDNGPIMCSNHGAGPEAAGKGGADGGVAEGGEARCGRLDPRKVAAAKLVSPLAWKRLRAEHGGGPTLAAGDVCRECLANHFNDALLGSQADLMRARVAALLEESGAGAAAGRAEAGENGGGLQPDLMEEDDEEEEAPRRFWVSRLWLQGWSKRQGASVKAEKSPTADIACPHGLLLPPATVKTARRVGVPGDVWFFVRDLWRQQRVREAQEALEARHAGSAKAGPSGRAITRGGGSGSAGAAAAAAVECLDLTGDDAAAASGKRRSADGGEDDDVVEVGERTAAEGRAESAAPSWHGGTADADDAPGGAAAASASPPPVAVPTPQDLDALCPELQVGRVHECRECRTAAGQAAEAQADTRRQVDAERTALGGLAAEVMPTLDMGGRYFLVPSTWVREWQQFVKPVSRRGVSAGAAAGVAAAAAAAGGAGTAAGSVPAPAPRPGPITDAMLRVLCPCHPGEARLGVPVPRLVFKRNKLCQMGPEQDALRIIMYDDWRQLCRLYGDTAPAAAPARAAAPSATTAAAPTADRGPNELRRSRRCHVSTTVAAASGGRETGVDRGNRENGGEDVEEQRVLELEGPGTASAIFGAGGEGGADRGSAGMDNSVRYAAVLQGFMAQVVPPQAAVAGNGSDGSGSAVAIDADDFVAPPSISRDRGSRDAWAPVPELRVWPPVCLEALAAHNRAAKEALLSYNKVEVMVELVPLEELDGAFRAAIQAPERKSRRSRKGRIALTVSNTTSLEQLKLQIYEHMSVLPRNQTLYVRGEGGAPRRLEGDDLSLAQHEVLPGEEFRLVLRNLVDNDDGTDLLGDGEAGRGKKRQVEEGFKNTALYGDLPTQQQQSQGNQQQPPSAAAGQRGAAGPTCSSGYKSDGGLSDG